MTGPGQQVELVNQSEFEEFLIKVEQEMVEVEGVPLVLQQDSEPSHLLLLLVDLLTTKPGDPQAVISVSEFLCQVEPDHVVPQVVPVLNLAVPEQLQVAAELAALFLGVQQ